MEDKIYNTPVLIIGAGPVGLALALELGLRGIQCLIVEQRDGKVTLPKMNTVNTRTMEFCRRWGVATKIKQAGIGEDYPLDIRFITSMAGYELLRFRYPTYRRARQARLHPGRQLCLLTALVRSDTARARRGRFPTSRCACAPAWSRSRKPSTTSPPSCSILESDQRKTVRASYLIGCDGADSPVREMSGVTLHGDPASQF